MISGSPASTASLTPDRLIRAVQALSTAHSLESIVNIVKRTARAGTGADGVSFVMREGEFCHYLDEDSIAPLWKGRRFPLSECLSGWTMLHRQAAAVPDITSDPRIPQDVYRSTFVRSLVMVPIRSEAPLGAIGSYWAEHRTFTPDTVHWLQALADATSAGIEAVRASAEAASLRRNGSTPPSGEVEPPTVRMCAWTKRLFYNGQWLSIEAFLRCRFGIEVTHGMSEDVLTRLRQEMASTALNAPPHFEA